MAINPILEAAKSAQGTLQENTRAEQAAAALDVAKVTQQTDMIVDAISTVGAAESTIQLTKDNAQLDTQNKTQALYTAAGGHDEQVRLMQELVKDGKSKEALLAQQAERDANMSIFAHWLNSELGGALTAGLDNQVRTATSEYEHTLGMIQASDVAQSHTHAANVRAQTDINQATIVANQSKITAQAKHDMAQAQLDAVKTNAVARTHALEMDAKAASNAVAMYRLQGEEETRAGQAEQREFARIQHKHEIEVYTRKLPILDKQLEDIELEKRFEAENVPYIQEAYAIMGSKPLSPDEIRTFLRDPQEQVRMFELARIGREGTLGGTPAEAKQSRDILDPKGNMVPTKYTGLQDEVSDMILTDMGGNAPREGTPEYASVYNMTAKHVMDRYAAEIKPGDATNPYAAAPFETLAKSRAVQETKLYQEVLSKRGYTDTNPQQIINDSYNAVVAGVVTPEEAARGITAIFNAAINDNNVADGGFDRVGFGQHRQSSYKTRLARPVTWTERLTINPATTTFSPLGTVDVETTESLKARAAGNLKYIDLDMSDYTAVRYHLINLRNSSAAGDDAAAAANKGGE